LAAVSQNAAALRFAPAQLQEDNAFVKVAISRMPRDQMPLPKHQRIV